MATFDTDGAGPRPLWAVQLPDVTLLDDLAGWARDEAEQLAAVGAIRNDAASRSAVAELVAGLAAESVPEGFGWSYVAFGGPGVGGLLVHVGLSLAEGGEENLEAMVGGPEPEQGHVEPFEANGLSGWMGYTFETRDPDTGVAADEGHVWITAGVSCRREIPGLGQVDLLAATDSPDSTLVLASLASLQGFVTGPELADTIALARAGG